jgi:hypothetical protein
MQGRAEVVVVVEEVEVLGEEWKEKERQRGKLFQRCQMGGWRNWRRS